MIKIKPKHIIVGMSGGVDSSVAALLLKNAGHQVEGVFMKNWEEEEDEKDTHCPQTQDMLDARAVCEQLNIAFHCVNFATEYWREVFHHFLHEYREGRTPNPDILCNKEIKFKAFLNYAKNRGADCIATGHYARIHSDTNAFQLLKGIDQKKDQSYFLYALNQSKLRESLFPLGDLTKEEVRNIAKNANFKNHAKKDSTGICFIGERKFKKFLNEYLPAKTGLIQTVHGETLGEHDGLMFYTIGQRQGLKLGGIKNKSDAPWYVVKKNLQENTLMVAQGNDHPLLFTKTLYVKNIHWIYDKPMVYPYALHAKTRYRQLDEACIIQEIRENHYQVEFARPVRAVTPGQSVVFYQQVHCLGGGIILDSDEGDTLAK
jgi:tRNA-uridine 2-sulfurtransferase